MLVHGVRTVPELAYQELISREVHEHELLGEFTRDKLIYYPTVTRERFRNQGRVTDLMFGGKLPADLGLPPVDRAHDRVMLCGSPGLLADFGAWFEQGEWLEGVRTRAGRVRHRKGLRRKIGTLHAISRFAAGFIPYMAALPCGAGLWEAADECPDLERRRAAAGCGAPQAGAGPGMDDRRR